MTHDIISGEPEPRRASCGARVCSADYTHGPHQHHPEGMVTLTHAESATSEKAEKPDTGEDTQP